MTTRRLWLGGGAAGLAAVALAVFGFWYLFIRDDAPPPVSLADAVAAANATPTSAPVAAMSVPAKTTPPAAATQAATPSATPTATPASAADSGGTVDGELAGEWQLVAGSDSFVGYRVQEELATLGAKTAVGCTSAVTASLEFDGTAITAVAVEADLTQLESDDSRRDGALGRQGIESNSFPTASFALTDPIVLDGPPEEGVPIVTTAVGELTLHGVTRAVEVALEGQLTNGLVVVIGSTEIEFADYEVDTPSAVIVLSIEDRGVMEFQLIFERV
jgi:polyisoprenoid-binding protein YceI